MNINGSIDTGICPRHQNSGINFRKNFADDIDNFYSEMSVLKAFWKQINNTDLPITRSYYDQLLLQTCSKLNFIGHFRLSAAVSILSKMGMIKKERLYVADWRTACKDVSNGSYDFINKKGIIPEDNNQQFFYDICTHLTLE